MVIERENLDCFVLLYNCVVQLSNIGFLATPVSVLKMIRYLSLMTKYKVLASLSHTKNQKSFLSKDISLQCGMKPQKKFQVNVAFSLARRNNLNLVVFSYYTEIYI